MLSLLKRQLFFPNSVTFRAKMGYKTVSMWLHQHTVKSDRVPLDLEEWNCGYHSFWGVDRGKHC